MTERPLVLLNAIFNDGVPNQTIFSVLFQFKQNMLLLRIFPEAKLLKKFKQILMCCLSGLNNSQNVGLQKILHFI